MARRKLSLDEVASLDLAAAPVRRAVTADEAKELGLDEGPGYAKSALGGGIQGITGGFFDDAAGLLGQFAVGGGVRLGKGAQPSPDDTPEIRALKEQALAEQEAAPSSREIVRDLVQADLDEAQAANPKVYGTGRVGGALLTAPLIAKLLPAGLGVGGSMLTGAGLGGLNAAGESRAELGRGGWKEFVGDVLKGGALGAGTGGLGYGLTRALAGSAGALPATMASGGLTGGAAGYLGSEAETVGGKLEDAVFPALLGGAGAAGGYAAAKATGGTARALVKGAVKPTPEAQYLRDQGVENLTLGQMNPRSGLGQMEEVGTSAAFVGPKLTGQRNTARETYAKALVSRAVPKGGSSLAKGGLDEQLADAYRQQNERYDEVRASPLSPRAQARPVNVARVGKALNLAANDPSIPASADDVATVGRYLKNQTSILQRSGATTENLMKVRQNIRDARASAEPGSPKRMLYDRAEGSITNRLQYALPAKALQTLRETDAGYGAYKNLEAAVANAKDGPLTPNNVTMAIKSNTDRGAYARGAGGELRQLARAGHEVFDQKVEPTGARLLASGRYNPLPWAVRAANSPAIKPYALGEAPIQQRADALVQALMNRAPKMSPVSGRLPELLSAAEAGPSLSQRAYAELLWRISEDPESAER